MWFLRRWARCYLLPDENYYAQVSHWYFSSISNTLVAALIMGKMSFLVDGHMELLIYCFHFCMALKHKFIPSMTSTILNILIKLYKI